VKNLSYNSTQDTLLEYFSQFWNVTNVKLLTDRNTWKSKWMCFVQFESRSDAKKALEWASEVDGRQVNCSWSNQKGQWG